MGCRGGAIFMIKAQKYDRRDEVHYIYSDDMSYSIWVSCLIFSLLLIALAVWMYDYAFIMKNYSCILTHMS